MPNLALAGRDGGSTTTFMQTTSTYERATSDEQSRHGPTSSADTSTATT
jgi:hypothetical protein